LEIEQNNTRTMPDERGRPRATVTRLDDLVSLLFQAPIGESTLHLTSRPQQTPLALRGYGHNPTKLPCRHD
jgi:hypothetical protein